ncbi:hypothetical protein B4U80_12943 [Leptotrombidium deliense]|uniref:Metalloendopeptidase n=1 Tax=Leptotrombidium deliense TaxID=299467 RepID=A0A443SGP4_9ACAR|nr:hypothetical protein B4U80_12943 [Leptotrombidium deliense]
MLKVLLLLCFLAISIRSTSALSWITNSSDLARANGKCPVDGEIYQDCSKFIGRQDPVTWDREYIGQIYLYMMHQGSSKEDRLQPFCGIEDRAGWKGNTAEHVINIANECLNAPAIAHMMMHVLGFPHEINHHNRDEFVHILQPNVANNDKIHFEKHTTSEVPGHHYRFDPNSIMHYHYDEFRNNDLLPVIIPLQRDLSPFDFGRAVWMKEEAAKRMFSYKDVTKLKEYYAPFEIGSAIDKKKLVNDSIPHGRQGETGFAERGVDDHDMPGRNFIKEVDVNEFNDFVYAGCRESLKGLNNVTESFF